MWNCIRCTAALTVAFIGWMPNDALLFGQTQLISSFENNLSSTVGATWEGPGIANSEFITTGATDGTHALAIHHDPNWNIQLILKGGMPLAQATASHDFLLIDATTTDPGVGGDGRFINWRAIVDVFNSNQGGWQQTQLDVHPVAADDGGSATTTLILDLTQPQGMNPSIKQNAQAFVDAGGGEGTYWELFLPMLGGDVGTPVKAGDYGPANDLVDAADYVTWRTNLGGSTLTNETASPGIVDQADYDEWRSHFGTNYSHITTIIDNVRFANAGSGAGSLAGSGAPEPSSAVLAVVVVLAMASTRRRLS